MKNPMPRARSPTVHGAIPSWPPYPADRLAAWEIPPDERVREQLLRQMEGVSEAEAEALVQEKIRKLHEPGYAEAFKSTMTTMADHGNRAQFNLIRRLPLTPVPTLFVIGKGDPSSEVAEKLKGLVAGSELHIIEDGAHQVHYENAEEFCKVVTEFLA